MTPHALDIRPWAWWPAIWHVDDHWKVDRCACPSLQELLQAVDERAHGVWDCPIQYSAREEDFRDPDCSGWGRERPRYEWVKPKPKSKPKYRVRGRRGRPFKVRVIDEISVCDCFKATLLSMRHYMGEFHCSLYHDTGNKRWVLKLKVMGRTEEAWLDKHPRESGGAESLIVAVKDLVRRCWPLEVV